jgi:hypothetical protein
MTEDYFKIILSQSKDNFKQINNPPIVVYNSKRKTVSVKYDFALGLIKKIKIIASSNVWLDFKHLIEGGHISFEAIEPYLYRPARDKKKKGSDNIPKITPPALWLMSWTVSNGHILKIH